MLSLNEKVTRPVKPEWMTIKSIQRLDMRQMARFFAIAKTAGLALASRAAILHDGKMVRIQALSSDDWKAWRALRIRALENSPEAFSAKHSDWQGTQDTEARWRSRLTSVPFNLLATLDDEPAGMCSATH